MCFWPPWTWGVAGSKAEQPDCTEVGETKSRNRQGCSDVTQDRGIASLGPDLSRLGLIRHRMPGIGIRETV